MLEILSVDQVVTENNRLRAENERLRAQLAEAKTLILSASIHMPSWPHAEARNSWIRDQQKWLGATQG
jgi:regulator of replication initiation timing